MSQKIEVKLEEDVIKDVVFIGGCNGNLSGLSKLITGMKADDVIEKLEGTTCGFKNTSCPDQLSKALKEALSLNHQCKSEKGTQQADVGRCIYYPMRV